MRVEQPGGHLIDCSGDLGEWTQEQEEMCTIPLVMIEAFAEQPT